MNVFGKIFLSALSAAMIASTAADGAFAPFQVKPRGIAHDPGGTVKTSAAVFQWASMDNHLPTGFVQHQVGDDVHLNCGASAGCVLFVQTTMEIASKVSGDEWFICANVDGTATDPLECFQGTTTSTQVTEGVYNGNMKVKKGSHKITFTVGTSTAADLFQWHEAAQMLH